MSECTCDYPNIHGVDCEWCREQEKLAKEREARTVRTVLSGTFRNVLVFGQYGLRDIMNMGFNGRKVRITVETID